MGGEVGEDDGEEEGFQGCLTRSSLEEFGGLIDLSIHRCWRLGWLACWLAGHENDEVDVCWRDGLN